MAIQKRGKYQIIFRTNKSSTGGSYYENMAAYLLSQSYNSFIWHYDQTQHKLLVFNKLKLIYQTFLENPGNAKLLITNNLYQYGINLKSFDRKILIIHHIDQNQTKRKRINHYLESKTLKELDKFDKIVVVAEYWKKFLSNYVNENKIKIIYNSFNIEKIINHTGNFYQQKFKSKYKIPKEKVIIYAGNSTRAKGIDRLLALLKNTDFYIVTSGKQNFKGINHHLNLPYSEYLKLLTISDVTILLTRLKEGWNRIAHESLLCGTPVIGIPIAGLGELIHKSGQVKFIPGEHDLIYLIQTAIGNKTLIKNGFSFAKQFNLHYFKNEWSFLVQNYIDS